MKQIFRNKDGKEWKQESGMMVVEAVLSFCVFMIVTLSIVYLINIFTVHNRVQFAINSAAHEISSFSYLYQAVGLRSASQQFQKDFGPYGGNVDSTVTQVTDSLNKIQGLGSSFGSTVQAVKNVDLDPTSIQNAYDQVVQLKGNASATVQSVKQSAADLKELFSDPNGLMAGIIALAASDLEYRTLNLVGTAAATGLTQKYLETDSKSADEYLKGCGVIDGYDGLDFSGSTVFADGGKRFVDIVVEYDIDMGFAKIILPEAKIHVIQRVTVPAWLDGDGQKP